MTENRTKLCRGGRREAILDVARKVFSEEGYAAASMSHIAARLGGSKGTLYNYFRSKEELFKAHVQDRCACHASSIFAGSLAGNDVGDVLAELAERALNFTLTDESTAFYSQVVSEAQRDPMVGHAFYESGPQTGIRHVAAFLETARAAGKISTNDCFEAAEVFLSLIHGGLHLRRVLNVCSQPSPAEIHAEAMRISKIFMLAYGVRPGAAPVIRSEAAQ
jgi:AcrR family transcriptional regulator